MVSRQETARPLLTPGEVMQLPPTDEIVMVAGLPPIRAKKLRYYEEPAFRDRALPAPTLSERGYKDTPPARGDDWTGAAPISAQAADAAEAALPDPANGGIRQEPELPEHEAIVPARDPAGEFAIVEDEPDDEPQRQRTMAALQRQAVRNAAIDRGDGMAMEM